MAANIANDTKNDELTRELLREMLRLARIEQKITEQRASFSADRARGWIRRMEAPDTADTRRWTWDDVYRWGRAVGRIVRPSPVGLNLPHIADMKPMTLISMEQSELAGIALLEVFRQIHESTGAEQIEFANGLGVGHGSMWALLNSDNPRIITLQRMARALGGELRFELEKCDLPTIMGWVPN